MSKAFIAVLSDTYRVLFFGGVALLALYAPFVYWRIYSVYRTVGEQANRLGFFWFSFQFQLPFLAKGMPNYLDLESVSGAPRNQIDRARHQIRLVRLLIALWVLLVLTFGATTAFIRRHYS